MPLPSLHRLFTRPLQWLGLRREEPPTTIAHGLEGVRAVGHRRYVGGLWDEIGRLQFEFLVSEGLRPHHYLLDIACGSLRAGVHLIPYLDRGHYLGVDKEPELLRAGREEELGEALYREKAPELLVSDSFAFDSLSARPDWAIAQSLFTHLPAPTVELCFRNLRDVIRDDGRFYATYFQSDEEVENPAAPHDHLIWRYTVDQMLGFGRRNGWHAEYIGGWGHPRGQVIVRYSPA